MTEQLKRCTACDQEKPLTAYWKKSGKPDTRCKDCKREYQRRYYELNKEKIVAQALQWQRENKERVNAKNAAWRDRNPGKQEAATAQWRANNPERAAANAFQKGQRRRLRMLDVATVAFSQEQLVQKWDYWGGKCWACGSPATATDHVKPIAKGGAHMLCNLRPICKSCNSAKAARWPIDDWLAHRKAITA